MYGLPRGVLNANPCNIRNSNETFEGELVPSKDKDFKQFKTSLMGLRAGAVILGNYYKLHGLQTVREIIGRWAPQSDNNTDAYVKDVCGHLAVEPDHVLDMGDNSTYRNLLAAITYHENGTNPYSNDEIDEAVSYAFPRVS